MLYYLVFGVLCTLFGFMSEKTSIKRTSMFCLVTIAVCFAGFRGALTTDYKNYLMMFNHIRNMSMSNILSSDVLKEPGFSVLTKILSYIGGETFYLFALSAVTILCMYRCFKKNASIAWVSMILFIGIGSYYTSFNLIRSVMAAAIVSLGYRNIVEGRFKKYLLCVIVAALFHTTALIMLPMYFLLRKKINKTYLIWITVIAIGLIVFVKYFLGYIVSNFSLYATYTIDAYGMQGGSFGNIVIPAFSLIFIGILILINGKDKFNFNEIENIVLVNGSLFYFLFAVMSLEIYMLVRLSYFFEIFAWILISKLVSDSKNNRTIITWIIVIITLLIPQITLRGTGYDPYYFIFNG